MSHSVTHSGWRGSIVRADDKLPFILVGVLVAAVLFTIGQHFHWHWHQALHNELFHKVSNHHGMWIFFAYLGLEITLTSLKTAGKFVGLATLGGMVVPPILAYILTQNLYIAIGACATDVAFSIGASKLVQAGNTNILRVMIVALLILAVGDDLGGVTILAGVYADNISIVWLVVALLVVAFSYFCGERGFVRFITEEEGKPDSRRTMLWHIEIRSTAFWVLFAFVNTAVLSFAGVEWVLGGCIVFILATANVKEKLIYLLKPFIPVVLLMFGLANGGIDLLDKANWGLITLGSFLGGMFGKQIGIFIGGLAGRAWSRATEPENEYGRATLRQIYALSLFGSVNGTVAIFFVTMGMSKGYISETDGAQAILGYFLTVPTVYLFSFLGRLTGWLQIEDKPDPTLAAAT